MNLYLFLALIFIAVYLLGQLIERFKIPWVFSALFVGALLAFENPWPAVTAAPELDFLANLGMYFLLFLIGLEIDLGEMKQQGSLIIRASFFIILLEALVGAILIHSLFGTAWLQACLVALSFATVGEAILVPILEERQMVHTRLGQLIIGVGTFDDIFEILVLVLVVVLFESEFSYLALSKPVLLVMGLVVVVAGFGILRRRPFLFHPVETLFLFSLAVLFLFVGIGSWSDAASLGALFAGIAIKVYFPEGKLETVLKNIRVVGFGFLAPVFFLSVGMKLDVGFLLTAPLLVVIIFLVTTVAKLLGSFLMARSVIGTRASLLMGIGLSVRFSSSIVIISLLYDKGIVTTDLYSAIIASTMAFQFFVPVSFSWLLNKWGTELGKV